MINARKKIVKDKSVAPTELEEEVAKAILDIEVSPSSDIKADLRDVVISAAKEVEVKNGRRAVIVYFPYRVWQSVRKIQGRLIRELEKKFQKKQVVFVANRTILDLNFRRRGLKVRPRSRTLTAVHDSILEDVVGPTEIVGRRTRITADGTKLMKIRPRRRAYPDKDKAEVDTKLATFSAVYKKLTNKEAVFMFPEDHMRSAGEVAFADILEEWDGRSKGAGIVEFKNQEGAQNAIATLNDSKLGERLIFVREDRESSRTKGGYKGGFKGGWKGDWKGKGKGKGGLRVGPGDKGRLLYVGNLPFRTSWQDLKDVFKEHGQVIRVDIAEDWDGRSKGYATVLYETEAEAQSAIENLHETEFQGRNMMVRLDTHL
ncbi:unnamed protein product [Prorocentrum cordatum]|uniref:RRM domain-containing protein n=1 Tax=Prorocentrum cordatum TaxID=2364126 RepID=A0ABN9V674_9DINO|nr:unnamed protein product [Polarella glacialis]